jgi:UDP-N-acetylmuramoyl-L-alanyl-D-glutamate--2,6-diaminopimelate ligase
MKKSLGKILGVHLPSLKITDIHWKVQDCNDEDILFYRIGETEEARRAFSERLKSAKFAWLITNTLHPDLPQNSSVIEESRWSQIQKAILDILYPLPALKMIGITGTNGKTTTTDLILQLGHLAGKKGISIGTLGVREYQKQILDFGLTSPSLIDLRKFISVHGKGKDFCVMEASSHALIQERLFGIEFDGAGWLSFSQDHLDYHKTMDAYFEAKSLILTHMKPGAHLYIPASQEDLSKKLKGPVKKAPSLPEKLPLFFSTQFNRDNLEVAHALVEEVLQIKLKVDFNQLNSPDGRFYIRNYKNNLLIVDFAHTPDALLNICRGIKTSFPGYKLKVLFGCGGDRDRTKRPLMGSVVDEWADIAYVTSDNPRTEDPEMIIDDILKGFKKIIPRKIVDRREAVRIAFSELNEKEVLLFAGKGHEDYILINGIKHPYSDIKEVDEFVRRNSP